MRKILFIMITTAALALSLTCRASGLVPKGCLFGLFCTGKPVIVTHPIVKVVFTFDGAVAVSENAIATIYSGKEAVATGVLSASNHVEQEGTQGCVKIKFSNALLLPKGKMYRLVVPKGAIFREGDPSVSNDRLSEEFKVPADLGPVHFDVKDGVTIDKTMGYGDLPIFYWGIETEPVGEPSFILYREGVPIREIPAWITWDWHAGQAYPKMEEGMHFEKGVHYSLVLPAGSARSRYRDDIVNREAVFNFVGGYEEQPTPIGYVWCSLMKTGHPRKAYGKVKYYYKEPVELSANPVVRLYSRDDNRVVKEAVPTLSEEENEYGRYVMTVDFENTPNVAKRGYRIEIPWGTVVRKRAPR